MAEDAAEADAGYEEWKLTAIEAALAESADRSAMIPAEQVWRELGFEG